jgi:lipopolysaccharide/colanic/teichoic acid biosynthesis glycosyltransferase
VLALARRRIVDVVVLTDYAGLVFRQARIGDLRGRPVILYPRDARYLVSRLSKRTLDVVAGAALAIVSAPFYVLYSLYAFSKARKPFVVGERLGARGESIAVPVAGSGQSDGPSDLVNLPLFWLVVIGKMSIVGPYPLRAEDARYVDGVARFRFDMRPGITGAWRSGPGTVARDVLLVQDAAYVQNWSLVNDAKLLVATFGCVLFGRRRVIDVVAPKNREAAHETGDSHAH